MKSILSGLRRTFPAPYFPVPEFIMQKTKLGLQGLEVSALGLGCMGMSDFYGSRAEREASESTSIALIHHALESGLNFLDTADMYGPFTNEVLVGRAIKDRRDQVVLATKFGNVRDEAGNFLGISGKPEYVRAACDASLKRLNLDHIDLYYQHRVDNTVPIEDTVGAMSELVQSGKVRFLGLSEAGPQTIERAHKVHPISALQTEYSLWSRDPEDEILPLLKKLGIGFVAYSPLGRGFLTGQIKSFDDLPADDYRRNTPRFQGENFEKNLEVVKQVEVLAREKECSAGQVALAWLLAQSRVLDVPIVPIPGTTKTKNLDENIAALGVQLSDEDLARIEEIAPQGVTAGSRYPEAMMSVVGR
jgi:aryl-alcohol dehydrogenase-like predicted oxidoreductase